MAGLLSPLLFLSGLGEAGYETGLLKDSPEMGDSRKRRAKTQRGALSGFFDTQGQRNAMEDPNYRSVDGPLIFKDSNRAGDPMYGGMLPELREGWTYDPNSLLRPFKGPASPAPPQAPAPVPQAPAVASAGPASFDDRFNASNGSLQPYPQPTGWWGDVADYLGKQSVVEQPQGIPPSLAGMVLGAAPFGLAGGAPNMPQTSSAPWWLEQAQKLGEQSVVEQRPKAAPQQGSMDLPLGTQGGANPNLPLMGFDKQGQQYSHPPMYQELPRRQMEAAVPQQSPNYLMGAMQSHGIDGTQGQMIADPYQQDLSHGIRGLLKRAMGG